MMSCWQQDFHLKPTEMFSDFRMKQLWAGMTLLQRKGKNWKATTQTVPVRIPSGITLSGIRWFRDCVSYVHHQCLLEDFKYLYISALLFFHRFLYQSMNFIKIYFLLLHHLNHNYCGKDDDAVKLIFSTEIPFWFEWKHPPSYFVWFSNINIILYLKNSGEVFILRDVNWCLAGWGEGGSCCCWWAPPGNSAGGQLF